MKSYSINDLQKAILIVLKEIDRICEKNNIKYIAYGGTLLGAIRHHGFIPWDDDADIAMPIEEYNKFISLCHQGALSSGFTLQEYGEKEPNYGQAWIRIRLDNTLCVIDYHKLNGWNHLGVFVDVFPFYRSYTDDYKLLSKTLKKYKRVNRMFNNKIAYKLNTFKSKCFRLLLCCYTSKKLFLKRDKISNSLEIKPTHLNKFVVDFNTPYGLKKGIFQSSIFEKRKKVQFEDMTISIPEDYDHVLKIQFGDYMKLPPEEKRKGHMPEEIDLEVLDLKRK